MRSWGLCPDFLCSLVAPAHFMRLSLKESRIRGRVQCSVQEIRVAPSFSVQVRAHGKPGRLANLGHPSYSYWVLL